MKLKSSLFFIFVLTLISLGVFLMILFNIDPNNADIFTISTFFISVFMFISGFLTFILFYLKNWFNNNEVIYTHLPIAIRQSVLISSAIIGILVFKSLDIFTVWDITIFLVIIILIELFFRSKKVAL
jgi:hypothetical protein